MAEQNQNSGKEQELVATPGQTVDPKALEVTKEIGAAVHETIAAKFNDRVAPTEVKFNFKTTKIKDDEGKDTGEAYKRAPVAVILPLLNLTGVKAILESDDAKSHQLLLEAVQAIQLAQAKDLVDGDVNVTAETFPLDQVSWEFIANMPKAERTGSGIAKETWEAFGAAWIDAMQRVAGKSPDQAKKAAALLVGKFAAVKTNKPVLKNLQSQLATFIDQAEEAADFLPCVDYLVKRVESLLAAKDEDLLSAL